jgi:glycosyltransferase involved in cell wall biosynthesis
MASDTDLDPASGRFNFGIGGPVLSPFTGRLGYEWFRRTALRGAHCVFVQNQFQLQACVAEGLPGHLLPSIVEDAPSELQSIRPTVDAVWVGNVSNKNRRSKGVAEFVRLAERSPEATFVLVGDLSAVRNEDIINHLQRLPNVELTGSLSHGQVVQRIAAARLVLNTSPSEGFSNAMLEGWSLHKPVVSLSVDPDHLLTQSGLGVCAGGDEWQMAHALELLLSDAARRQAMGDAAHTYVSKVHNASAVCERFEILVSSLVAGSRAADDLA